MQLGRQAARAQVIARGARSRCPNARAPEQLEEGGLRIGARDHGPRRNALAGLEHARRPRGPTRPVFAPPARRCGSRRRPRSRPWRAHRTTAPTPPRGCASAGAARRFGRQAIQERQYGAGRARSEIRAEHRVEAERALESIGARIAPRADRRRSCRRCAAARACRCRPSLRICQPSRSSAAMSLPVAVPRRGGTLDSSGTRACAKRRICAE